MLDTRENGGKLRGEVVCPVERSGVSRFCGAVDIDCDTVIFCLPWRGREAEAVCGFWQARQLMNRAALQKARPEVIDDPAATRLAVESGAILSP